MGYQKQDGGYADTDTINLHTAATRTTAGTATPAEMGDRGTARLALVVTGSPVGALDVTIETAPDLSGSWTPIGTFPQATAAGTTRKVITGCDRFVRARYTPSGASPSFTFSIAGEAV